MKVEAHFICWYLTQYTSFNKDVVVDVTRNKSINTHREMCETKDQERVKWKVHKLRRMLITLLDNQL